MSDMHTQGEWIENGDEICTRSKEDDQSFGMLVPHAVVFGDNYKANARRIVACVNACEGIPTDHLEKCTATCAVDRILIERDALKVQRDELLAALKIIADGNLPDGDIANMPVMLFAQDAIAKAEAAK